MTAAATPSTTSISGKVAPRSPRNRSPGICFACMPGNVRDLGDATKDTEWPYEMEVLPTRVDNAERRKGQVFRMFRAILRIGHFADKSLPLTGFPGGLSVYLI